MLISRHQLSICLLTALLAGSTPAWGAGESGGQTFLGRFGDWYAYELMEEGRKTCYIVSKPTRSKGKYKSRGDVVAFVTHRPKEGETDVVNFQAGYTYKKGSKVTAKIGDETFTLITDRDAAWSRNAKDDRTLVSAMIKGLTMMVTGRSKSGVSTTDIYSLRGFTNARKRINRSCKVK